MPVRIPLYVANRVSMSSATSYHEDGVTAVAELASALGDTAALYAIFVSPGYDLDLLGPAIEAWCGGRVIGCTSSGNIGPDGYQRSGILAVAFSGGGLRATTLSVGPLTDVSQAVEQASVDLAALRVQWEVSDGFAVLLVDGLAMREDRLAAALMATLGEVPIVGGSAGDALAFTRTAVLQDGRFVENSATLTMITLDAPFQLFRLHHHEPTDAILVATDTAPEQRLVRALNGRPASEAYAEAVGLAVEDLTAEACSARPLMLLAAGSTWVRSISAVHPDGSLGLLAAVETGEVLRVCRPVGMIEKLEARLSAVAADFGEITGVLAFDCVLRRLEFEASCMDEQVGRILARNRVVGFSTYGEQFNGMHMNQTLVAVAFGAGREGA